jgi:OOP family OmpA-OmpF porin
MNSKSIISVAAATAMALAAGTASAAGADEYRGFYAGIGAGISGADLKAASVPNRLDSERGGVLKLFGGYQINRFAGVEGGYDRTGNFSEFRTEGGTEVHQAVKSHAWYVAATGRIPIGEAFALTGKFGVAFSNVNGDDISTSPDSLYGKRHSQLIGLGGQYRINSQMDLQLEAENIAHASRRLSVGMLTLSVRKRF